MKSPLQPQGKLSMDRINRWKLADELNVYQIVLLIAGYDHWNLRPTITAEMAE